jgi:hypothetical protein
MFRLKCCMHFSSLFRPCHLPPLDPYYLSASLLGWSQGMKLNLSIDCEGLHYVRVTFFTKPDKHVNNLHVCAVLHELFVSYVICICISRTARTPETGENCKETISYIHTHAHTFSALQIPDLLMFILKARYVKIWFLFAIWGCPRNSQGSKLPSKIYCVPERRRQALAFSITILLTSGEVRNWTPALSNTILPTSGQVRNVTPTLSTIALYTT